MESRRSVFGRWKSATLATVVTHGCPCKHEMSTQCRDKFYDAGPTLTKHWVNILWLPLRRRFLFCLHSVTCSSVEQSEKAITAYFSSKQLLFFCFAWQRRSLSSNPERGVAVGIYCPHRTPAGSLACPDSFGRQDYVYTQKRRQLEWSRQLRPVAYLSLGDNGKWEASSAHNSLKRHTNMNLDVLANGGNIHWPEGGRVHDDVCRHSSIFCGNN